MSKSDAESLQPFIEDKTSDEQYRRHVSRSWCLDTHNWSRFLALRSNQRRRNVIILAFILILFVAPYSILASSKAFRTSAFRPPPFYCSTWDSATPIPDDLWTKVYSEYRAWTTYDHKPSIKLRPEQWPVQADEESKLHSSTQKSATTSLKPESKGRNLPRGRKWKKPEGVKVVAMIFFGRTHQVDLLDCYLQENMVQQGGYLDEVHFIEHTTHAADLDWLHNLVNASPGYKALQVAPHCRENPHQENCRYERIWEHFATDDDTIYIKIDDDIVYIHEETIPRLVQRRIEFAQPFAISANIVNSPITAWLHYRLGAIHPYLPEPVPTPRARGNQPTWRASELPPHPFDAEYQSLAFPPTPDDSIINSAIKDEATLKKLFEDVPFPGHRWLPLSQNTTSLLYTPMSRISADPWGNGVHHWATSAQQHYSLLQNIEEDAMHRYYMASLPPHGDGLFNPQYTRYNLNFIAVWGKDIVEGAKVRQELHTGANGMPKATIVSNMHDDEKNITVDMPRALGRPMVIDVQAVVAHMHFHDQEPHIQMTDLLDRWRAYANEKVCSADRQKKVPGQPDGLGYPANSQGLGWWQCPWIQAEEH